MNEKFKRTIVDDQKCDDFVTCSRCWPRRLFDLDLPKKILLGVLNHQLEQMNAKCVGFVVMQDHVHALIWLPETGQLSRFMHGWKRILQAPPVVPAILAKPGDAYSAGTDSG